MVGRSSNHVKKSTEFVHALDSIGESDSFDAAPLLTRVSNFLSQILVKTFWPSTHFSAAGQFYEQTGGADIDSPLSPAIAKFFME
jgi:hypothetical protein